MKKLRRPVFAPRHRTLLQPLQHSRSISRAYSKWACNVDAIYILITTFHRRALHADIKGKNQPTQLQLAAFQEARVNLRKRIAHFRKLQEVYMPGLRTVLADPSVLDDIADSFAENASLYMPSALPGEDRLRACVSGIVTVETRIREAAAYEALDDLRRTLRTRTYLNKWRVKHISGQHMTTRARSIQHTIDLKVLDAKVRYRQSRTALWALRGSGIWEDHLRDLRDEDVRTLNDRERTQTEKEAREYRIKNGTQNAGDAQGGIPLAGLLGDGTRTLSWIWMTASSDENSAEMIEGEYFIFIFY